jgi:RND family efflux transporter MFP subunit
MRFLRQLTGPAAVLTLVAGCGGEPDHAPVERAAIGGTPVAVLDTVLPMILEASGTAQPLRLATMSTKLMATVTAVPVHAGDRVAQGQLLLQLDARDLEARRTQVEAALAEAGAMQLDAASHAARIRGLFADSAATQSQLDQSVAALARADAGVARAAGMAAELAATASYAEVRAPFGGVVTARLVDPGAFAAPGAPLVTVEDASSLRVSVSVAPEMAASTARGQRLAATIGDTVVLALVEGVVRSGDNLYTINALVPNPRGRLLSGSAVRLAIPQGERRVLAVPAVAVIERDGMTGVHAVVAGQPLLRWVRLGSRHGDLVEVLGGLAAGDTVLVPAGRD